MWHKILTGVYFCVWTSFSFFLRELILGTATDYFSLLGIKFFRFSESHVQMELNFRFLFDCMKSNTLSTF